MKRRIHQGSELDVPKNQTNEPIQPPSFIVTEVVNENSENIKQ